MASPAARRELIDSNKGTGIKPGCPPDIAVEVRPKFLEGKLMHAGMLADVERVQVEAESANLPQQRTDGSCQTVSAVGVKAVLHQHEVVLKFFGILVGRWNVL